MAAVLLPAQAWAHVKWFAPYDVALPPVPIGDVMTPRFLLVLAGFALLVFDKLDAIGHLPTIASLAAMFLHGPTPLHHWLRDAGRGLLAEGRRAGITFAAAMGVCFAAYYGLQQADARLWAGMNKHAALAAWVPVQVR